MHTEAKPFGTLPTGEAVTAYTLSNGSGLTVEVLDYGGIITRIVTPDRAGKPGDVNLGFDTLAPYTERHPYFGAIVGRYANRIRNSCFTIDGVTYHVTPNKGDFHLHGGNRGFDRYVWDAELVSRGNAEGLQLSRVSTDGEEGYPGNLRVQVTYWVTEEDALRIDYDAETDQPTVLNLTNHAYFNLDGVDGEPGQKLGSIVDHVVQIHADRYTEIGEGTLPTGAVAPVEGTALDLRTPTRIGDGIDADELPLKLGGGYDHNFVLHGDGQHPVRAAEVYAPKTGRVMTVDTTQPAIQFYTSNNMREAITGKGGVVYDYRTALCLETQHYPDSPNHDNFPSTVLRPGERYAHTTTYAFSTRA